MAKVTPNIASELTPGVISKVTAINPNKSINGQTSNFAGFDPTYSAGGIQKVTDSNKYSARNAQSGHKVFTNEAKRPGTDPIDQRFYAHIA